MGSLVRPVILCGGAGARLWPVSTRLRPKPFHRLNGRDSLLQETVRRLTGPDFLDPILVCGAEHASLVRRQMKAIAAPVAGLIIETQPCGTGVAAALGALAAEALEPGQTVLITPADHVVADPAAFRRTMVSASLGDDGIALFGAPPDGIEVGYGHIRVGEPIDGGPSHRITAFVEKPDAARALAMVDAGDWLWNMGLFLARADRLLQEVHHFAPELALVAQRAWTAGRSAGRTRTVTATPPDPRTETSLDRAVMEASDRLTVTPCDVGWRDVGSWQEIWRAGARDTADNRLKGPVTVSDSSGCLVWSSGPSVAVIGLNDIVVVTTPQGVLVMPRSRAQEVTRPVTLAPYV